MAFQRDLTLDCFRIAATASNLQDVDAILSSSMERTRSLASSWRMRSLVIAVCVVTSRLRTSVKMLFQ